MSNRPLKSSSYIIIRRRQQQQQKYLQHHPYQQQQLNIESCHLKSEKKYSPQVPTTQPQSSLQQQQQILM
jgi:hypothetical protein